MNVPVCLTIRMLLRLFLSHLSAFKLLRSGGHFYLLSQEPSYHVIPSHDQNGPAPASLPSLCAVRLCTRRSPSEAHRDGLRGRQRVRACTFTFIIGCCREILGEIVMKCSFAVCSLATCSNIAGSVCGSSA